jgi:V8-like Glu-specific endopeptidase
MCGATLVSLRTVVTAAHCVVSATNLSLVTVFLGTYDKRNPRYAYSVSHVIIVCFLFSKTYQSNEQF